MLLSHSEGMLDPNQFNEWLSEMGISAAEAARQLGLHPNTLSGFKSRGTSRLVDLACVALYHRLDPTRPAASNALPSAVRPSKLAFDRNAAHRAYMAKYMRLYRAKKRAELNSRPAGA